MNHHKVICSHLRFQQIRRTIGQALMEMFFNSQVNTTKTQRDLVMWLWRAHNEVNIASITSQMSERLTSEGQSHNCCSWACKTGECTASKGRPRIWKSGFRFAKDCMANKANMQRLFRGDECGGASMERGRSLQVLNHLVWLVTATIGECGTVNTSRDQQRWRLTNEHNHDWIVFRGVRRWASGVVVEQATEKAQVLTPSSSTLLSRF